MATNTREIKTVPDKVWEVLADGWLYPLWVVGATRMRDVESSWPQTGAQLYHSVGVWPAIVDDSTEVLESRPGAYLKLRARGWPIGEAEVAITLTPSGPNTLVEIQEKAVSGPGSLVPAPLEGALIRWRNVETLRRLALIAENRQAA
jgi:uncharacterized protein YndB with AHSA1/START domain